MSGLPTDLQKLPPKALDVLRFLGTREHGAHTDDIIDGTGFSSRSCRKAIRRLVTRHYLTMPESEYYVLTNNGKDAAQTLRELDGAADDAVEPAAASETAAGTAGPAAAASDIPDVAPDSTGAVPAMPPGLAADPDAVPEMPPELGLEPDDESEPTPDAFPAPETATPETSTPETATPEAPAIAWHRRRISAFMPKEMVEHAPAPLRVGFDAPGDDAPPLHASARLILRISVPGSTVEPSERPLEVRPGAAAGPVRFRITPDRGGTARVRIEAFQLVAADKLVPVGGVYFDMPVSQFPTPNSAEFQTLATTLRLHPGEVQA